MNLICCDFNELSKRIKEKNARIVMFGAGAIGQVTVPEILNEYGLISYVDCYLDNDQHKWGDRIKILNTLFEVHSPDYLESCPECTVILLNISRFYDVFMQIESMKCTEYMDCCIMPMMLIHNFCSECSDGSPVLLGRQMIPKKLHYMWLGGKSIPDNLKRCMDSWGKFCPDYEIIEWNENNYNFEKDLYMKQAYDSGAFGFVPDYARLEILYNEGGIYLDTDVELKRNIDDMLYQEAFCGVEKWQIINFGGMSGAVKGHPMIKKFLNARKDLLFIDADGKQNRNTCGYYDTRVALKEGYRINGLTQNIGGMNIYASDFFHPYDYMSGILYETEKTHSIHWFNGGWLDEKMKKANEEAKEKYLNLYVKAINNGGI